MISKELFVSTMKRLDALNTKMNAVDDALHELSPDFCSFYVPEMTDIVVDLLKEVFNDNDDWLDYLVYEKDFLRSIKPHDVKMWDRPADLTSWDKVYDFLIKNTEE